MTEVGGPLVVDEVDLEPPRVGEVMVEVAPLRRLPLRPATTSTARFAPTSPVVLGHEAAGVVVEVGAGRHHADARRHGGAHHGAVRAGAATGASAASGRSARQFAGLVTSALPGRLAPGCRGAASRVHRGLGWRPSPNAPSSPADGGRAGSRRRPDSTSPAIVGCAVQTGVGAVLNTAKVPVGDIRAGHRARRRRPVDRAGRPRGRRDHDRRGRPDRRAAVRRPSPLGATHAIDPDHRPASTTWPATSPSGRGADFAFDAVGPQRPGRDADEGHPQRRHDRDRRHPVHRGHASPSGPWCTRSTRRSSSAATSARPTRTATSPGILELWACGAARPRGDGHRHRRPLPEINEAVADMRAGSGVRTVLDLTGSPRA